MPQWAWIVVLATAMEAVTCLFRFGLGLEATRDTGALARFTFGFRVHHGYIGLLMVLAALWWPQGHLLRTLGICLGWALFLSDMVHHFLVLWPITGDPQFHIRYPASPRA